MLKEAAEKLQGVKVDDAETVTLLVTPTEEDPAVFDIDDTAIGNGHPEHVRGQILDAGLG